MEEEKKFFLNNKMQSLLNFSKHGFEIKDFIIVFKTLSYKEVYLRIYFSFCYKLSLLRRLLLPFLSLNLCYNP